MNGTEDYTQEVHKEWRNVVLISFNQLIFSVAQSSFINSSRLAGYKNKNYLWFFSPLRPLYYIYSIPKFFSFHHFLYSHFFFLSTTTTPAQLTLLQPILYIAINIYNYCYCITIHPLKNLHCLEYQGQASLSEKQEPSTVQLHSTCTNFISSYCL